MRVLNLEKDLLEKAATEKKFARLNNLKIFFSWLMEENSTRDKLSFYFLSDNESDYSWQNHTWQAEESMLEEGQISLAKNLLYAKQVEQKAIEETNAYSQKQQVHAANYQDWQAQITRASRMVQVGCREQICPY